MNITITNTAKRDTKATKVITITTKGNTEITANITTQGTITNTEAATKNIGMSMIITAITTNTVTIIRVVSTTIRNITTKVKRLKVITRSTTRTNTTKTITSTMTITRKASTTNTAITTDIMRNMGVVIRRAVITILVIMNITTVTKDITINIITMKITKVTKATTDTKNTTTTTTITARRVDTKIISTGDSIMASTEALILSYCNV